MALHSTDIEKQIADLHSAITKTENEHKQAAFQYAETGNDDLKKRMLDLRGQVDYFKGVIRDNEAALQFALQKEAQEYDASAIQGILDEVEAGKQLLTKRVEIAKRLDKQFVALGKVMDEFMDITEQVRVGHYGLVDVNIGWAFQNDGVFNKTPQIFGWQNVIKKAGLSPMASSAYVNNYTSPKPPFEDVTLADCIAKQHENIRYRKKVQLVLDQQEEAADV
ncbi:MAG: hypothetical protein LC541_04545 [Candidatus Thiodiazotropha sp.]|nr:hypothetical protein [Candidatus Thiodiazotropha sp.]MCM8882586.1 hypothetical protein [Candidatus Thiodiazotropha sp.]MCM8918777.1 hypothetical protein [Candidatus Thiodiazotropha sp.]